MAMCEKCTKNGYEPSAMFIDHDTKGFIGPCCTDKSRLYTPVAPQRPPMQVLPFEPAAQELEYGIELSNKVGVHAYLNYQGLQISFERTPAQLKKWAEQQGLVSTGT